MKCKFLLMTALAIGATAAHGQLKVGNNPDVINGNSMLEVESTDKGLLLPRVALTGTANFAPLTAHVAGMVVYNTATAGDVTPGYYYNDGAKWVRTGGSSNLTQVSLSGPSTPAGIVIGQMIYNTNAASGLPVGPAYWNGTQWVHVSTPSGPVVNNYSVTNNDLTVFNDTALFNKKAIFKDTVKINGGLVIKPLTTGKSTDSILVLEPNTGVVRKIAPSQLQVSNIYNSDGTLSGTRTVDMNGNNLYFKNASRVGIGTTNPAATLDVAGNARILNIPYGSPSLDSIVSTDSHGNIRKLSRSHASTYHIIAQGAGCVNTQATGGAWPVGCFTESFTAGGASIADINNSDGSWHAPHSGIYRVTATVFVNVPSSQTNFTFWISKQKIANINNAANNANAFAAAGAVTSTGATMTIQRVIVVPAGEALRPWISSCTGCGATQVNANYIYFEVEEL
jgi:hypothetical protein